jgi:hypothetical protein
VGHACELHHAGISVTDLRSAAHEHGTALGEEAALFWKRWLDIRW